MALTKTALQKLGASARGTAPKRYREGGATKRSQYADPKRFKYPIDTLLHIRAALSYFAKPKNREGYSTGEQRSIARRIVAAARKSKIAVAASSAVGRLAGMKQRQGT